MTYISMLHGGTDSQYHRSPIIIHDGMWYCAEFQTVEQLDFFAKTLGFTYELTEEEKWMNTKKVYQKYRMSHDIKTADKRFWTFEDLPDGVKPIKALSNGHIVTCYYINTGDCIVIYRPNPNAKEVYKPLSLTEHINHQKIYGSY